QLLRAQSLGPAVVLQRGRQYRQAVARCRDTGRAFRRTPDRGQVRRNSLFSEPESSTRHSSPAEICARHGAPSRALVQVPITNIYTTSTSAARLPERREALAGSCAITLAGTRRLRSLNFDDAAACMAVYAGVDGLSGHGDERLGQTASHPRSRPP